MDDFEEFTEREIILLINVVGEEIFTGTTVTLAREYIEIIDKLEKIRERKHDKSTT